MNGDTGFEKVEGNRGWLRHGNPPFDLRQVKQCGAKNRAGSPCRCPAMANGRCRLHGGKSTGPKTPEGKARIAAAQRTHGRRTVQADAERKANTRLRTQMKVLRFLARKGIDAEMTPEEIDRWLASR